jgi:predicted NBD/HSP70 family sugar kinase
MKALSQKMIREHNLKLILLSIADNPRITRAELAKKTKLTKTTVSSLVDELLNGRFINETAFSGDSVKPGRKPLSVLELDASRNCILVITWEKKRMIFSLVAMNSSILFRHKTPIENYKDAPALIESIYTETIHPFCDTEGSEVLGLSVVFPGIVDSDKGSLHSTILDVIEDNRLPTELKKRFPALPLGFFNDTACLGYAETKLTELSEKDFAYLNLNEGVGAVLFAEGKMHRGAGAVSCQFGHMSLDRHGPLCACGNRGCTDILLGEIGLPGRGMDAGYSEKDSPQSFEQFSRDLAEGNPHASALAESFTEDLAHGIGILISLNNPRIIVIGGKGAAMGQPFLELVKAKLKGCGFRQFTDHVDLHYTRLSLDAMTQGAARYFLDIHYRFSSPMNDALILG